MTRQFLMGPAAPPLRMNKGLNGSMLEVANGAQGGRDTLVLRARTAV